MRRAAAFLASALLACAFAAVALAGDAAKDIAKLEQQLETTKLASKEASAEFRPQYEAFAKAHAGTEEGLTARLRLLQFLGALPEAERKTAAAAAVDQILKDHPRSVQLERILDYGYLFDAAKQAEILKHLEDPAQPDRLQARAALARLRQASAKKDKAAMDAALANLTGKWKDVPWRTSTYGEIADAIANPHAETALAVGQPAPEIAGRDPDGKPITLSGLKGRVVVIDFFGDW